jgi:hypothetical protein
VEDACSEDMADDDVYRYRVKEGLIRRMADRRADGKQRGLGDG